MFIGPQMVTALIAAAKDNSPDTRCNVVRALGNTGDPRAVPVLIAALKDKEEFISEQAAQELGNSGDPRAVPALIAAAKDMKDDILRVSAIGGLGSLHDSRGVPALIDALKDNESGIRATAVSALQGIPDERALGPLIDQLEDGSPDDRATTLNVLRCLTGQYSLKSPARWRAWLKQREGEAPPSRPSPCRARRQAVKRFPWRKVLTIAAVVVVAGAFNVLNFPCWWRRYWPGCCCRRLLCSAPCRQGSPGSLNSLRIKTRPSVLRR